LEMTSKPTKMARTKTVNNPIPSIRPPRAR
jgi:hypothetical protein